MWRVNTPWHFILAPINRGSFRQFKQPLLQGLNVLKALLHVLRTTRFGTFEETELEIPLACLRSPLTWRNRRIK